MEPGSVELVERILQLGVGGMALLVLAAVMRGLLVTKLRFDDMVKSYERLLKHKDEQLEDLAKQHDWWKDATVTALQIGEQVAVRATRER